VRDVQTDGALGMSVRLVELERTGEQVLVGRQFPLPLRPGTALGVRVFDVPEDWDGVDPLRERELSFDSEPELYSTHRECPVVSAETRERRRRGWAF
jgi:hypothetical protein